MMWTEDYCPICKEKLVGKVDPPVQKMFCLTQVEGFHPRSHYERRYRETTHLYHEQVVIYPYLIDSYENISDIYKYDKEGKLSRRLLAEIPPLRINWNDLEATIQKIQLYILMS
jgi:hypothetical protein